MVVMKGNSGSVNEYITAMCNSDKFGPQVVKHKIMEPAEASMRSLDDLLPELKKMLNSLGITKLYSHQADAISYERRDNGVNIVTVMKDWR